MVYICTIVACLFRFVQRIGIEGYRTTSLLPQHLSITHKLCALRENPAPRNIIESFPASPHLIEKYDSKWFAFATITVLGQAPSYVKTPLILQLKPNNKLVNVIISWRQSIVLKLRVHSTNACTVFIKNVVNAKV